MSNKRNKEATNRILNVLTDAAYALWDLNKEYDFNLDLEDKLMQDFIAGALKNEIDFYSYIRKFPIVGGYQ